MIAIPGGMIPALDPWGPITGLGAELLAGDVQAFGAMIFGTPDAAVSAAYFACTKGRFRMVYPYTEHAVVVEGSARLTDERTGVARVYTPGDAWFVEKGTPVLWEVLSDRFTKNYLGVA